MTNNNDFQKELQEKVKAGVKPSDLKKSKSTPVSRSSFNNEKYVTELETEKDQLLKQIENYKKEQKARVVVFKDQERLLAEKEQQLISKDEQLSEKEEQLEKLKTRIHQLFKDKKEAVNQETSTEEKATQTEPKTNSAELEEQLLEKRLQSLKDFGDYREKLAEKETEISQLNEQITLYQTQIRNLLSRPNREGKKLFLLTVLLIITTSLLLFK